jgi:hypothetical protein
MVQKLRISVDACGQAIGDVKALFDLAQHQNAAVRRQQATVGSCLNR